MREYKGYIYCITNSINSKVYIGQTKTSVKERYATHLRCVRSSNGCNYLLYLAMRKYGVNNFSVETIECIFSDSKDDLQRQLDDREIFYIKKRGSLKPGGYNMTLGGNSPPISSQIPVMKLSEDGIVLAVYESIADASRQNNISTNTIRHALTSASHYSSGFYWRVKDKCLNILVGDSIGKHKRIDITPVFCYSLDGKLIKQYESIADAGRETNTYHGKISEVCKGNRQSAGGYLWSYSSVPPEYNPQSHTCRCKSVMQLTLDGETLKEFKSASEAARKLGLQSSLITACCTGRRKSTGGYRWTFSM